jgi:O-antigen ligase
MVMILVVALWMVKDIIDVGWKNISMETRLGGPFGFGGENDIAAFLVFYPVIALTLALFEKKLIPRLFLLGVFTIAMFPLILSMSRGAYLGMAVVLLFIGIVRFRWLLLLVGIAALTYQFWVPGTVQQRMQSTVVSANESVGGRVPAPHEMERNLEASSAQRVRIWRGALRIIESHPVTGIGYNGFQPAVPKYANMEWGMDAHNMYLRVAAEMGVGGFIVFILLFLVPFFSMWFVYRTSQNRFVKGWMLGMMASICGILVVNVFGSRFVREELVGLYWILIALTYAYIFLRRNRVERMHKRDALA